MLKALLFACSFVMLFGAAHAAATVEGNRGVGCADKADAARILSLAAGDQKLWAETVQGLIGSGQCRMLMAGDRVRIDERDVVAGIVRIAPARSVGDTGVWTDARSISDHSSPSPEASLEASGFTSQSVILGGLAAVAALALLAMYWRPLDIGHSMSQAPDSAGVEVWEEQQTRRSVFGKLTLLAFAGFNLWALFDVASILVRAQEVRDKFAANGFAQMGINNAVNARLWELFVVWAIGTVVLGLAVLGTRGKKQLVRRQIPLRK